MIDPFGLRQGPEPSEPDRRPEAPAPSPQATSRKRFWAVLLILDTVVLVVFGGALVATGVLGGGSLGFLREWLGTAPAPQEAPRRIHAVPKAPAPPAAAPSAAPPAPEKKAGPQPEAPKSETPLLEPKRAKPVEFACVSNKAREVYLKGSFLVHGKNGMKRMKKGGDGEWRLSVSLFPGTYKYYCVFDGKRSKAKALEVAP